MGVLLEILRREEPCYIEELRLNKTGTGEDVLKELIK